MSNRRLEDVFKVLWLQTSLNVYLTSDRKRPVDVADEQTLLKIRLPDIFTTSNRLVLSG